MDLAGELSNSSGALATLRNACTELADSPPRETPNANWQQVALVTDEESRSIAESFEAGMTITQIAEATGWNRTTIQRHLKRHNVNTGHRKLDPSTAEEIAHRYLAGASTSELGEDYGVHQDTIRRSLIAYGITIRRRRRKGKS